MSNTVKVSRLKLFKLLRNANHTVNDWEWLESLIVSEYGVLDSADSRSKCSQFCYHAMLKWQKATRREHTFLAQNTSWLEYEVEFFKANTDENNEEPPANSDLQPFAELSDRHKRRRTECLRQNHSAEELLFAGKTMLNASNDINSAKVVSIVLNNPEKSKEVVRFFEGKLDQERTVFSKEKALSIYVSLNLSKAKYKSLRKLSLEGGCYLYPSYEKIQLAKMECYPPSDEILITETTAQIQLQALMNHTAERILKIPDIDNQKLAGELDLISKWGMDGSNQIATKQKFTLKEDNLKKPIDSFAFSTYLVPLQLSLNEKVVWKNPRPSSSFFCRPVRFEFTPKETDEVIKNEHSRMTSEIEALQVTKSGEISVKHTLVCTMVDGKICNTLSDNNCTLKCYICGAYHSDKNDLDKMYERPVNVDVLPFGMAGLHAMIRTMECLVHLSYKIETDRWLIGGEVREECRKPKTKAEKEEERERKKEEAEIFKTQMAARKQEIQSKMRNNLGILVDFVKQGFGSTNDGNCARKFFEDPSLTAKITGLDEMLIKRFKIILQVIVSGKKIDPEKYHAYSKKTAELYVNLYGQCKMSPTVHKLLIHGADIIKNAALPIGELSEEALEARHKEFRNIRRDRSRGIGRCESNQDVLHGLLTSSDPYISELRYQNCSSKQKKNKALDPEAAELLDQDNSLDDSGFGDCITDNEEEEEESEEEDTETDE